jgi:hypothetical protein
MLLSYAFVLCRWLQPPAHAGSSIAYLSTLKIEAIRSSETSVHTKDLHGFTSQKTALFTNVIVGWLEENAVSYLEGKKKSKAIPVTGREGP